MEKREHKIHYAQYSHLETVPIVSQKSLCPLHVIQADAQSESELNVVSEHQSYSAEWISLIQYSCGKKLDKRQKYPVLFGKGGLQHNHHGDPWQATHRCAAEYPI